ncbi:DUF2892 domain-containing protein [Vogesella sp. LYT5W]|uniref:DUF2892 domain-containing protein n=1 Tax=Vogesella margarita TaxID=2984199 RepID=A0ABT5ISG2_9NEIS|nr:DUF2892 domain-containing protein [Vogesella margarita]MDC7715500.1 DUF2892 domain-containing protein [Vogesella margarita]
MFYQKNLPLRERVLRVLAGSIAIAITLSLSLSGWLSALLIASAGAFLFFGFIGFCPMCALAGRKPVAQK